MEMVRKYVCHMHHRATACIRAEVELPQPGQGTRQTDRRSDWRAKCLQYACAHRPTSHGRLQPTGRIRETPSVRVLHGLAINIIGPRTLPCGVHITVGECTTDGATTGRSVPYPIDNKASTRRKTRAEQKRM
ncbi:hypothetical protein J6590_073293 [Homalodisca vitripennis]|nr:hypothetical protein J6590_073293 [Homalodisca vitripennis]